ALGRVELRRGDAQIEGNAGNRIGVHRGEQSLHVPEPAFENLKAPGVALGELAAALRGVGIAVDAENTTSRRGEQCPAVTAAAKCAVTINGIVARRQGVNHRAEKNGNMRSRLSRGPASRCCL